MDIKRAPTRCGHAEEAKSATREAIVAAAIDTVMAERSFAITLNPVAERAGVTVKTELRHFTTREALLDAAWARAYDDIVAERTPPSGDSGAALALLVEHYERRGDMALGMLADENNDARARRFCDTGRAAHREWVEQVFGAGLPGDPAARTRLVDALVVATDVYCWKLLRRDRGLSAADVCDRMRLLTDAVLATARETR